VATSIIEDKARRLFAAVISFIISGQASVQEKIRFSQTNDTLYLFFLESFPVSKIFFRPEEIHRTSGIRQG